MAHSNWNGGDRKLEILNIKRTNICPKVTKERTAAIRLVYSSCSSKRVAQHALTLKNICLPFTEQTKNVNMPKYKRNADMFITCKITELSTYFQRCKVYSRVLIIPLNKILIIYIYCQVKCLYLKIRIMIERITRGKMCLFIS